MSLSGSMPESSNSGGADSGHAKVASAPRPRRRRWWRYLLAGSGISLVLLSLLVFFLPQILKPTLNRWTPDALAWLAGLDGEVVIRHWDWKQLDIEQARLTLDDGTEIRLQSLSLVFTPQQLGVGKIQSLVVEQLDITLQQSGEQVAVLTARQAREAARQHLQSSELNIPDLPELLSLPIEQVQIQRLNIHHEQVSARLSAELVPQHWQLNGDIELADVGHPWQLTLQLDQHDNLGDWIVQLADGEQLLMQAFVTLKRQDDGITQVALRQQWQADQLQPRFPMLRDLPVLPTQITLTAEASLPPTLRIPDDLVLTAQLEASTRPGALNDAWQWRTGEWQLTLEKQAADSDWLWSLQARGIKLSGTEVPRRHVSIKAGELHATCRAALSACELGGDIPVRVSGVENISLSIRPELALHDLLVPQALTLAGPLKLAMDAHVPIAAADTPKDRVKLTTRGKLMLDATLDSAHISSPGFSLHTRLPVISGWKSTDMRGRWGKGLSVTWESTATGHLLQAEPVQLALRPLSLAKDDVRLNLDHSDVRCIPALARVDCDLNLALLPSEAGQWPLPDTQLQMRVELDLTTLDINARLALQAAQQQLALRGFIQHQVSTGVGALQWHLQQARLNWGNMGLAELSNLTSVQLLGGQVSGQGWVDWALEEGRIEPDVMLRGDDISLIYDNTIAADHWSLMLSMQTQAASVGVKPSGQEWVVDAQLAGESLNSGVELSNLLARSRLRLTPDWYELNLYEIHMDVLGGQIQVPAARYDSRKAINAFGVELYRVQLDKLAALEPNAGIEATGVLDGVLPIVLTAEGPTVPGGNLFARPPGGILRYNTDTSASLKQADPTVGLAMQALENFHYTRLDSGITYAADGALNLALQFQGANPDFFDGQATHLNVNLDYNLLDLLESLRVANDVVERLEDKYQ